MPETDTIPVSASIASTGKGIRYIGDYCYGLSGEVENAAGGSSTMSTLLEFTTGSGMIMGNFLWGIKHAGAGDSYTFIKFNDQLVFTAVVIETGGGVPFNPVIMVVPPFTKVTMLWGIDGATKNATGVFTGRVYGAE